MQNEALCNTVWYCTAPPIFVFYHHAQAEGSSRSPKKYAEQPRTPKSCTDFGTLVRNAPPPSVGAKKPDRAGRDPPGPKVTSRTHGTGYARERTDHFFIKRFCLCKTRFCLCKTNNPCKTSTICVRHRFLCVRRMFLCVRRMFLCVRRV